MSRPIIEVTNVSKRYRLGEIGAKSLREEASALLSRLRGHSPESSAREFWALRDVSFQIQPGEVVGIIGRNGAGKSTLLKVLSRITEPTSGRAVLRGRVASLLEVGTGFHPDLSGRDNIFLNGAILGMSRAEIRAKFDEIVAFAEVEKFIDTPVKRYSSGMYVRLAFAVAAHLDPEILIVDEVLAVGDAQFQQKCLGKMQDITLHGRTVIFVSHNMLAVQKLCTNAVWLQNGLVRAVGACNEIVTQYSSVTLSAEYHRTAPMPVDHPAITHATILTEHPRTDRPLEVLIEWSVPIAVSGLRVGIGFNAINGERIFGSAPEDLGIETPSIEGRHLAIFTVPAGTFLDQTYTVALALWSPSASYDYPNPALKFSVQAVPSGIFAQESQREGMVYIPGGWHIKPHST